MTPWAGCEIFSFQNGKEKKPCGSSCFFRPKFVEDNLHVVTKARDKPSMENRQPKASSKLYMGRLRLPRNVLSPQINYT